jgi:transmembrane sensor
MSVEKLPPEERVRQLEEAADWVVRLGDPSRTESDVSEWLLWCDARRGNLEAFELVQQDWHDAAALTAPVKARARPRLRVAAGAFVVLVVVAASLSAWFWSHPKSDAVESGAMTRAARLPDGSSVTLSPRTVVHVSFAASQRRLTMSSGEAYFKVHHEADRQFVVDAGEIRVTAVGTAFDVRRDPDAILVTVEEGTVAIASASNAEDRSPNIWQVGSGYQLVYTPGTRSATLVGVDPARALQWRSGELAYVGAPLKSVIDDVNRYSDRRIVLADASLGGYPYSGTVFTRSIDDWVQALIVAYPLRLERGADGVLILERAAR